MKKLIYLTSVLFLLVMYSCQPSDELNGIYYGQITHNGSPSSPAQLALTGDHSSVIFLTVSSQYGNFVQGYVNIDQSGGWYGLSCSFPTGKPNELIVIDGYYSVSAQKIEFTYTLDIDGAGSAPTQEGSYTGSI